MEKEGCLAALVWAYPPSLPLHWVVKEGGTDSLSTPGISEDGSSGTVGFSFISAFRKALVCRLVHLHTKKEHTCASHSPECKMLMAL